MRTWTICAVAIFLVCFLVASGFTGTGDSEFSPYVGEDGVISRPTGYRVSWVHMGSWAVPDEDADGYGFHDVYTQRGTIDAYRKTGKFPDGAVLVKEIRGIQTKAMSTGQRVHRAGDVLVWFVMVRDNKGRFPGNRNWGKGWGWALYKQEDPDKNVSENFERDCIGCHIPAQDTDWVYVEGYPTLRK